MEFADSQLKIYIFADGSYPYNADFESVIKKVSLIALPFAFNHALKKILPEPEEAKLEEVDLTDEEKETMLAEAEKVEENE